MKKKKKKKLNLYKEIKKYLLNFNCDIVNFDVSINIENVKLFIKKHIFFSIYINIKTIFLN